MFSRLLILFILVPMIELMLLIRVGEIIGFWATIGIIVLTGLLGSSLARQQGMSVWTQFNSRLQKGQLPGTELVDGLIILISGALLLTPGILTDFVGFLGLVPFTRKFIRNYTQKRIKNAQASGAIQFTTTSTFGQWGTRSNWNEQANPPADSEPAPTWQGTPKQRPDQQDPD